jgi:tRNA G18 (ribose-2'-O)-methylase SpoU
MRNRNSNFIKFQANGPIRPFLLIISFEHRMGSTFKKLKLNELGRIDTEGYKSVSKIPLIVVLDNIRSLHNIGSVFRTCDAFLISEIWLTGFTAQPPHREIQKTALGSTETVKWVHYEDPELAILTLKEKGYRIVPLEQAQGSTNISDLSIAPDDKIALILGNEVDGVSDVYMSAADEVLEIPQEGTKHSLNVSVSAGIALWEVFRRMSKIG